MGLFSRSWTFAALALLIAGGAASPVEAGFITYTESVTGSGTLGVTPFTNATVTFTQIADLANIQVTPSAGAYAFPIYASTVTISSIGAATFLGTDGLFVFTGAGSFVLQAGGLSGGAGILAQSVLAIAGTTPTTPIGPAMGSGAITSNPSVSFGTNSGYFNLNSISSNVTFTSTGSVVPEPSSLALCGIAGVFGIGMAWKRRKQAKTAA